MTTRIETDALGAREIPAEAYWGIHTLRASENFPISGLRADPELVAAYGAIKAAAARANVELGVIDAVRGGAVERAALEVHGGQLHDHVVVDVYQAGAGTSLHMNVNEVVANRALELLGRARGDYAYLHPNDHVNRGQSTNDTFPTAMRLALLARGATTLARAASLGARLEDKGAELDRVLTAGRTHLQDALPIRYGQVLRGYATALRKAAAALDGARDGLLEMPLGGTAVGTGVNAHPSFAAVAVAHLAALVGLPLRPGRDLVELVSSLGDVVSHAGALRRLALELSRVGNDLRLLASGPATGLGDLRLPPVQAGSSIMPGKVNPSIPEMVNMVCFQVLGNDRAVELACEAGQLQLNVMMPLVAHALLTSHRILGPAMQALDERCVAGLDADRARCAAHVASGAALATFLAPVLGYEATAALTKEALALGRPVAELIVSRGHLTADELARLLDPERATAPAPPSPPPAGGRSG